MIILETQRLYLRQFTPEDAKGMYLLNLDPDVIKFTGDEPFRNISCAQTFLENYDHYSKYDFGRWAVINKSNDEFLGWCGLKYTEEIDEYDIGFRIFKKFWNMGFATEVAKPCLDLGFNKYGLPVIYGRALKENKGSIRVLEKIGMKFFKEDNLHGKDGLIYRLENRASL